MADELIIIGGALGISFVILMRMAYQISKDQESRTFTVSARTNELGANLGKIYEAVEDLFTLFESKIGKAEFEERIKFVKGKRKEGKNGS